MITPILGGILLDRTNKQIRVRSPEVSELRLIARLGRKDVSRTGGCHTWRKSKLKIQPLRCCPVSSRACGLGAANRTAGVAAALDI